MSDALLIETAAPIATLAFNRPEQRVVPAANAPLSVRGAKVILARRARDAPPGSEVIADVYVRIATCLNSADVREGKRAFPAERRPAFRGE